MSADDNERVFRLGFAGDLVSSPRAAIVIPLLKQRDEWLEQCVRSAIDQTVPCTIVVVTAPNDTTQSNRRLLQRLSNEGRPLRVLTQTRPGFAAALNAGIACARERRIGFLLSDDWLEPTAVEMCLQHRADIVGTGAAAWAADGKTPLPGVAGILRAREYAALPTLEQKARYLEHFFLFRRTALVRVGGLDEGLGDSPGIDDYDLIWTLLEAGATVHIVEEALYNHRDHAGLRLTTGNVRRMRRTMSRILAKHGLRGDARRSLLDAHARWFGKPTHVVLQELDTPRPRGRP